MRIVLSNSSYKWGGLHLFTEQLAAGLRQRGHELSILCRPGSRLHDRLAGCFDCSGVVHGGDLNPLGVLRIAQVLRALRPQVVLTLTDKDLRLSGAAAAVLGLPVVARRANDQPLSQHWYARFAYTRYARRHVANSLATRATMLASAPWLRPHDVSVIYNGLDVRSYDAARPADLPVTTELVVGLLARLERRKGVRDLLDAWSCVSAAAPEVSLVIAGTGPLEAEVRERAQNAARVHLLGVRDDVPALLKRMDVVVVPSHWEGFGFAAAEAMAAGRPVVATRVSSLPEIVRDGVDGLLVPSHDPPALADAILRLVRHPEVRRAMGAAARARIASEFPLDRMVERYEQLLLTCG